MTHYRVAATNASEGPMRARYPREIWIAAVVVGVLAIAGCGGDGADFRPPREPATSTPKPTATPTTAPSNTVAPTSTVPAATATPTASSSSPPTATAASTQTTAPSQTPSASPTATQAVPDPTIEGPITGPGNPFVQATNFDLASVGYSRQEYFISGTARSFVNVGELGSDGLWGVATGTVSASYKTRIMVHRPIDPQQFNGSVVVEWLNVSGGLDAAPDWISAHTEFIRAGYVWVGVSAQFVGVEGRGGAGPIPGLPDLSLKGFGPVRYGSLSHPGDTFSYDMFSQVGQAIRHPVGIDPLGGLRLERLIAAGESQSAFRLTTYVNAIHPLVRLYDGFLIHSRGGGGAALSQAPQQDIPVPSPARIRSDLDVPVLTFQTETDLLILNYLPDRQEDGPLFRLWEVAGTSHADTYTLLFGFNDKGDDPAAAKIEEISAPIPPFIVCDGPINAGPQHFVLKAAFAALERWIRDGEAPPMAPRLEVTGSPPAFVLDDLGNVRGGIRTPYVDAPIARLSGLGQSGDGFCRIFGTTALFDDATLATLYADHDAYVAAVNAATDSAVAAGFILEPDAQLIRTQAAESDILN
jgi:Alpha/beta hydrolase domain